MSQTIMMAATLARDRHTASGATDAPHLPAAARNVRGPGGRPAGNDNYARSPDVKSERGDDGGKCVLISGRYEEKMEVLCVQTKWT